MFLKTRMDGDRNCYNPLVITQELFDMAHANSKMFVQRGKRNYNPSFYYCGVCSLTFQHKGKVILLLCYSSRIEENYPQKQQVEIAKVEDAIMKTVNMQQFIWMKGIKKPVNRKKHSGRKLAVLGKRRKSPQ